MFRQQVIELLSNGVSRLKAGPFEVEWARAERKIPVDIRKAAAPTVPDSALEATASVSPRSAILTRYDALIGHLGEAVIEHLGDQPDGQSAGELIDVAAEHGLIDATAKEALLGITVMRNLTAHGPSREIDDEKVLEFFALAEGAEYAMNHWLTKSQGSSG